MLDAETLARIARQDPAFPVPVPAGELLELRRQAEERAGVAPDAWLTTAEAARAHGRYPKFWARLAAAWRTEDAGLPADRQRAQQREEGGPWLLRHGACREHLAPVLQSRPSTANRRLFGVTKKQRQLAAGGRS